MSGKMTPEYHAAYYQKYKYTKFKEYRKRFKASLKSKDYERKYRVKNRYNLTRSQHIDLLNAQNWTCAFFSCLEPVDLYSDIDHAHTCCPGFHSCGKCVRGILCHQHNTGLSFFEDHPVTLLAAFEYLKRNNDSH